VTWTTRHEIISDGVSYLEIATAYAGGHWSAALNAYWSPLFSWLIAIALVVIRPTPYWQDATMHLVIFVAYVADLGVFEFFLTELITCEADPPRSLPVWTIYTVGYSCFLFATLSLVGTRFCSPDMIGVGLTLLLAALLIRISRTGGSNAQFFALGVTFALCYFTRTALLATVAAAFVVVLVLLGMRTRPLLAPALIMFLTTSALMLPFVTAISLKQGELTLGEAGRLNYAWELDGAHRWVHWQGEPYDIGVPLHPTKLVLSSPKTFTFTDPVPGSYAPWYDPAYWYAGVKPKLRPSAQLWVFAVNSVVFLRLFLRSPIVLPVLILAAVAGLRSCWSSLIRLWPVLIPILIGIAAYSIVYVEKRYLAGALLVIWMAVLAAFRSEKRKVRIFAPWMFAALAIAFLAVFLFKHVTAAVHESARDLLHHRERWANVNYVLAERLHQLGLCPGDKVAYIGPAINAEWARLAHVKIVAEIPLMYSRNRGFLNNQHIDDPTQIRRFFTADPETREHVLNEFRKAGAKIVVTDGFFSNKLSDDWQRIIPANEPGIPEFGDIFTQVNSRYFWLSPPRKECDSEVRVASIYTRSSRSTFRITPSS
jgi:hypothetical protein